MKKFYRIILILIAFIFLTTYSPSNLNVLPEKENFFFEVQNIKIINNNIVNEKEIKTKLAHIYGANILTIKRNDIATPLESIDFLGKIEVKKKYPNTLVIKVYETKPIALLVKSKKKYFLDSSSNLIFSDKNLSTEDLPSVFGEDAEKNFMIFFDQLENNNFSTKLIKNFYYFRIGRWDLELFDKKIIKFPSNKTIEAIQQSVELLSRQDFENYDIIDLRIHGKIVTE